MKRENVLPLVLGLVIGLLVGLAFGVHHPGQRAEQLTPPTPAEELALWQEIGFNGDAARVLVTRSRTGLVPSQVMAELTATAQGPAPQVPATQASALAPRDPNLDCARLAGPNFESPADWERALLGAGEPWASIARSMASETDATRRLDGLLAGFQVFCPPAAAPAEDAPTP